VGVVIKSLITKEPIMNSLVVRVAGVVVGAIGTRLVPPPKPVGQKLRAVAALALEKLREAGRSGQPKGEGPAHGPEGKA
jgi:hypothetical protein